MGMRRLAARMSAVGVLILAGPVYESAFRMLLPRPDVHRMEVREAEAAGRFERLPQLSPELGHFGGQTP
jgi:hypothetical protein